MPSPWSDPSRLSSESVSIEFPRLACRRKPPPDAVRGPYRFQLPESPCQGITTSDQMESGVVFKFQLDLQVSDAQPRGRRNRGPVPGRRRQTATVPRIPSLRPQPRIPSYTFAITEPNLRPQCQAASRVTRRVGRRVTETVTGTVRVRVSHGDCAQPPSRAAQWLSWLLAGHYRSLSLSGGTRP